MREKGRESASLAQGCRKRRALANPIGGLTDGSRYFVRVVEDDGTVLAEGKDVAVLQRQLAPAVQETISHASRSVEISGLAEFPADGGYACA